MSTETAKVPDDNKIDWQAIDIFIFSNGQKYSPPRKYHLRAEELNWWDATLNFLARSQYGSNHPLIHLYTIDGHKIEGPLELKDGGAYVAVEPPDLFINASYHKYLVKASRSWEKRQAKKGVPLLVPDIHPKPAYKFTQCCCPCLDKEKCDNMQLCCKCPRDHNEPGEPRVAEGGVCVATAKSQQSKVTISEQITITMPVDRLNQTIIQKKYEAGPCLTTIHGPCIKHSRSVQQGESQEESECVDCINRNFTRSEDTGCQTGMEKIICTYYGPVPSEASLETADSGQTGDPKLKPQREFLHREGDKGAWIVEFDPKSGFRVTSLEDYTLKDNLPKIDEQVTGSKTYEQKSTFSEKFSKPVGHVVGQQENIIIDSKTRDHVKNGDKFSEQINIYEETVYPFPEKVELREPRPERIEKFKAVETETLQYENVSKVTAGEVRDKLKEEVIEKEIPAKQLDQDTDKEVPAKLLNENQEIPAKLLNENQEIPAKLISEEIPAKLIAETENITFETKGITKNTKEPLGETEKVVTDRKRVSNNLTKLPGENGRRISSEAGKISTDTRKLSNDRPRISGEQGRRISSEPARISVEVTRTNGEYRRRSGEPGKFPNRRISVEHGRTSIVNGKTVYDHSKISFDAGKIHRDGDKPLDTRAENGTRLSSGGASGSARNRMPLALEYKRRSSAEPPPTPRKRLSSLQAEKKVDDGRPSKKKKDLSPTSTEANTPDKLPVVSEKTKLILETFSRPGEISTQPDLEETIIKTTSAPSITEVVNDDDVMKGTSQPSKNVNEENKNVKKEQKDVAEKEMSVSSKSSKSSKSRLGTVPKKTDKRLDRSTNYATHYVSVTRDPSKYSNSNNEKITDYTKSSTIIDTDRDLIKLPLTSSNKTISSQPHHQQNKTDDDDVITIINKGDVVKLKLNIELNGDILHTNHKYNKRSRSLTNIAKTEKGSQISVDQEVMLNSKSLQSILNNQYSQANDGHPKVVIVQCGCCGHRENEYEEDSKKYSSMISRDAATVNRMSSGIPVKKTRSNTSLETLQNKGTGFPFQKQDVQMYVLTANNNSQTGEARECSVTKRRVSITEGPESSATCMQGRSVSAMSVNTHTLGVSKSSLAKQRHPNETWTQTEFCNVLLEARRHNDGRYSFHLPPLHVLRYYDLS